MLRPRSPRSLEAAIRDLDAARPETRQSAAEDLARHASEHRDEVLRALHRALHDEHPDVRATAATALGDIADPASREALSTATRDEHDFVRQMALSALAELRSDAATPTFEKALDSSIPSDRFQAVLGFARSCRDDERVQRVLLAATRDEDPLVRHIALRVAEERGGDRVVAPIFKERARALLDDDSDVVRVAAAVILGRLGDHAGADVLAAVASRDVVTTEHDDEAAAIELCGDLRIESAAPALEKRAFGRVLLLSRDPFVWHARVALAALGHGRAMDWILTELRAWTRERRTLAVAAAGRAQLDKARPLLEAMVGDETRADPNAVREALARLSGT